MLTDAQIEQITAKYGACNHDALQEAARMGVELMADPSLRMIEGLRADLLRERNEALRKNLAAGACACIGPYPLCSCEERRLRQQLLALANAAQPHTPPAHR